MTAFSGLKHSRSAEGGNPPPGRISAAVRLKAAVKNVLPAGA